MADHPHRILIVGAGLAGTRTAVSLREQGFQGELVILGEEDHPPYDRPPLSKRLLLGQMESERIFLRGTDELAAEWMLGERAVGLDLGARSVHLASGPALEYDRLLIATGSRPRRLPQLDLARPGIHELRTLGDCLRLREAFERRPRVAIVGAGFIGVEVAAAARGLGLEVTIVSLDPPLAVAGELVSQITRGLLSEHGVELREGRTVTTVEGAAQPERLVLDDGSALAADLVLSAVGARPAVDWLEGSGLQLQDGVVCDAWLAPLGTTGIAAAGDVARWPHGVFGVDPIRVEHWSNAGEQAETAAATLLHGSGSGEPHAAIPNFWSEHFGVRLQSIGLPHLGERLEVIEGDVAERRFVAMSQREGRLVGAISYNLPRPLLALRQEIGQEVRAVAGEGT